MVLKIKGVGLQPSKKPLKYAICNVLLFLVMCSTLLMVSFAHAEGVIQLPQTGQTVCYDTAGTEIACATTGQDGEIQVGAAWQPFGFFNCKLREIV